MQNQRNVNRFDPETGAVDNDFWIATDGGVQACVVDANLGLLFVGGHFDCVREWLDSTTPVDPSPSQCGTDPLFVGTVQRDLFALTLAGGELTAWNPDTGGTPGIWAAAVGEGRLFVGGEVRWPRQATTATHQNLLAFDVALFADGFERGLSSAGRCRCPHPRFAGRGLFGWGRAPGSGTFWVQVSLETLLCALIAPAGYKRVQ